MKRTNRCLHCVVLAAMTIACGPSVGNLGEGEGEGEGESEGESEGGEPVPECGGGDAPERIAEGSDRSLSFSPSLPPLFANADGSIVYTDDEGDAWLASVGAPPVMLDEGSAESIDAAPSGRWFVVSETEVVGDTAESWVRVIDTVTGEETRIDGQSRDVIAFSVGRENEGLAIVAEDVLWAIDDAGARRLIEGVDTIEVASSASVAVTEGIDGHTVVDLVTGDVRPIADAPGWLTLSRDGRVATYAPESGGQSFLVIDTASGATIAELDIVRDSYDFAYPPIHAVAGGHTLLFRRPGEGVALLDEALQLHERAGAPIVGLGTHEALVRSGDSLQVIDVIDGSTRAIGELDEEASMGNGNFDASEELVVSRDGTAIAFADIIDGVPRVVIARADATDITMLAGVIDEFGGVPHVAWVGDDGSALVDGPLAAGQSLGLVHLLTAEGEVRGAFELAGYGPDLVIERADHLLVRSSGYPGEVVEIDRSTGDVRVIASGDVMEIGDGGACEVALSIGCATPSDEHDVGPTVDWQLYRLSVGGAEVAPLVACAGD